MPTYPTLTPEQIRAIRLGGTMTMTPSGGIVQTATHPPIQRYTAVDTSSVRFVAAEYGGRLGVSLSPAEAVIHLSAGYGESGGPTVFALDLEAANALVDVIIDAMCAIRDRSARAAIDV